MVFLFANPQLNYSCILQKTTTPHIIQFDEISLTINPCLVARRSNNIFLDVRQFSSFMHIPTAKVLKSSIPLARSTLVSFQHQTKYQQSTCIKLTGNIIPRCEHSEFLYHVCLTAYCLYTFHTYTNQDLQFRICWHKILDRLLVKSAVHCSFIYATVPHAGINGNIHELLKSATDTGHRDEEEHTM